LKVHNGEGNFVVVDAAETNLSADYIVTELLARGVFIRSLRSHRAGGSLVRITVGDAEQNRRCVQAFSEVVRQDARRPGVVAKPAQLRSH